MTPRVRAGFLKVVSLIGLSGAIAIAPLSVFAQVESTPKQTSTPTYPSTSDKPAMDKPATSPNKKTSGSTKKTKTIAAIASTNPSLKTLSSALKAAGLKQTLSGKEPYTVFAPTDAAFAKLPKGTLDALLKPENKEKLVQVLTYHVIPGSMNSTGLKSGEVNTVEGSSVKVKVGETGVLINNAKVTKKDIKASNGVIHVIDKVLLPSTAMTPSDSTMPSNSTPTPGMPATPAPGASPATPTIPPATPTIPPATPESPTVPGTSPTTPGTSPTTPGTSPTTPGTTPTPAK